MSQSSESAEIAALIRESAEGYVSGSGSLARARRIFTSESAPDAAAWHEMAGLGWTGMLAPEACGGGAMGVAEAVVLHVQLGRGLVPEPLAFCAHLPVLALASATAEAARTMVAAIAGGEATVAVAWQGKPGTLTAEETALRLEGSAGAQRLKGEAVFVVGAASARWLIAAARGPEGVALYRVAADDKAMRMAPVRLADGTAAATVVLDGVAVTADDLLCPAGAGGRVLDAALEATRLILAAELLGVMRETFDRTLDYLRTRKQFGRAIGSFQALQHRAVDLYVQIELTSAALASALEQFAASDDPLVRAAAASSAKARASDAACLVGREAVQLHGAIAYTQEHDAGLFLARAMTGAALLGNATAHRRRYAGIVSRTLSA